MFQIKFRYLIFHKNKAGESSILSPTSFVCTCKDGGTPPDCQRTPPPPIKEPGSDDCENDQECQEFHLDFRLSCYHGNCQQQRCDTDKDCASGTFCNIIACDPCTKEKIQECKDKQATCETG